MRFTEMRLMEWAGRAVAIAGFAMSAQMAGAQSMCDYYWDSTCTADRVDSIVVVGSNGGGGGGSYDPYGPGSSSWSGGAGTENAAERAARNVFEKYRKTCIKKGESQEDWLIRITQDCAQVFGQGIACYNMRTLFNPAAAEGKISPPPPPCL